jgi:hypothetical protein
VVHSYMGYYWLGRGFKLDTMGQSQAAPWYQYSLTELNKRV